MVLGKLPVPGRPTILITVGQGPTALAAGAGGGCLDIFTLIYPISIVSPSLWETARYRLKYCLKGPLNPKQPTNQLLRSPSWATQTHSLRCMPHQNIRPGRDLDIGTSLLQTQGISVLSRRLPRIDGNPEGVNVIFGRGPMGSSSSLCSRQMAGCSAGLLGTAPRWNGLRRVSSSRYLTL